jgi:hypothetical protein
MRNLLNQALGISNPAPAGTGIGIAAVDQDGTAKPTPELATTQLDRSRCHTVRCEQAGYGTGLDGGDEREVEEPLLLDAGMEAGGQETFRGCDAA